MAQLSAVLFWQDQPLLDQWPSMQRRMARDGSTMGHFQGFCGSAWLLRTIRNEVAGELVAAAHRASCYQNAPRTAKRAPDMAPKIKKVDRRMAVAKIDRGK
jgi:hypothetical protein